MGFFKLRGCRSGKPLTIKRLEAVRAGKVFGFDTLGVRAWKRQYIDRDGQIGG
jgi:hypothetical protein